jgi:predicted N-acetyltransferase YhbS
MAEAAFAFAPASPDDLERLVALRIAAMREGLERVGVFTPERGRQWMVDRFRPDHTRLILVDGAMVGCVALWPLETGDLWLSQFYIDPAHQGRGLGGAVMRRLLAEAAAPIRLSALVGSPSNRLYLRHGFVETHRDEIEIYYRRPA